MFYSEWILVSNKYCKIGKKVPNDAVRSLPENLAKMPFVDGFICIPTYVDKDFDIGVFQGRSDLVKLYDFAIAIGKKHIL